MAVKISGLSANSALAGTDLMELAQGAVSTKATLTVLQTFVRGAALTDLAAAWTPATTTVAASLILPEATNNGVNKITVKAPDALAADWTMTLPPDDGTPNQVLQTDGNGVTTWVTSAAVALVVGTTVISSGSTTRVLFNNAGLLGEYAISGTGSVAMTTSPIFTTPNIGVATATSLNGLTITSTTGTLTIPAAVVLTGPAASGTAMTLGNAEAVAGIKTFATGQIVNGTLRLGTISATTGQLLLANSASAFLTTIQAGNAAAARTYTWPTNFGAAGTQLTDAAGDGTLSWAAAGGASGLTVGTTTITSGTTTRVLFDNAGVLGEYVISGSGNVAMTTSPVFTTPSLGVATATSINGLTITTSTGTLTVPNGVVLTGPAASGTAMTLGNAETVTGVKTFTAATPQIILGVNTTTLGSIKLFGSTSGDVTVKAAAVAGTATVFQLPPTNGSNTNVLQTDGAGVTSWVAAGGAGGITVGTTTITSGTTTRIPYNNAGVYAEATGVTSNGTGLIVTANGALSSSTGPGLSATGTWITGGTGTTTKPYVLIETAGATSTGWSTAGTGLGVNAATGFAGNLIDAQLNGSVRFSVFSTGAVLLTPSGTTSASTPAINFYTVANPLGFYTVPYMLGVTSNGVVIFTFNNTNGDNNTHLNLNLGTKSLSGASAAAGTGDVFLGRAAAATWQFGAANVDLNANVVAQTLTTQGPLAGGTTNQAGKDFTILVSPGKGTGAGGQLILQTTPAGASSTSINAAATGLTITAPAVNMQPSCVLGNQAIATTATDGFLYAVSGAGTPTGVPTTFTGRVPIYIDTTNSQLWLYLGGAWKQPKTPAGAALVTWQ